MLSTMPKRSKKSAAKSVIYLEVPTALKQRMEQLAEQHNRRLTGECIQALQEYVARHNNDTDKVR
jgi:predicted transcriptional regulator